MDEENNEVESKPMEKLYIGTKIIKAYPMDELTFLKTKKDIEIKEDVEVSPNREGYLVKYDNGYQSWSPKEVFESVYRLITDSEKELLNI